MQPRPQIIYMLLIKYFISAGVKCNRKHTYQPPRSLYGDVPREYKFIFVSCFLRVLTYILLRCASCSVWRVCLRFLEKEKQNFEGLSAITQLFVNTRSSLTIYLLHVKFVRLTKSRNMSSKHQKC